MPPIEFEYEYEGEDKQETKFYPFQYHIMKNGDDLESDSFEREKIWFRPVCNEQEIERIFNIKNSRDYILKIRAETIIDHMRLFRVYRNKAIAAGEKWSLEKAFCGYHYIHFKNSLNEDLRKECENVAYGNIFATEPNGLIFKSDYGVISTISDSIKFFLEFMNLALRTTEEQAPGHVQRSALRIALRIMLQTESLDFDLDPRGIIPKEVQAIMRSTVPFQLQYIAGHEYAHYLLGHLDSSSLKEEYVLGAIFNSQENYKPVVTYNTSQKQEFEADIASMTLPNYSEEMNKYIFESALLWFAYLDIFEGVKNVISPPKLYQTHPSAKDRYFNLLEKIDTPKDFEYNYWTKDLPNIVNFFNKSLTDDVSLNFDSYEFYGSIYLDKPNTKWRGKELIDRVDYY